MKIRNGFVSNSSSSSFVIGKAHMTKEQIMEFSKSLDKINDMNYGEGYIEEYKYYFMGTVSNNNNVVNDIIDDLGLNEFASYGE